MVRLIDRATFNWGSEILNLFVFALLLPAVGPKNSYHFLYQSDAKLKPITAWSGVSIFPAALHAVRSCYWEMSLALEGIFLSFNWLLWLLVLRHSIEKISEFFSLINSEKIQNFEILKRCSSKKTIVYISELTIPSRTFPKTTCLPSNQLVFTVVIKNCEPLVSLPALAILSQPGP